MMTFAPFVVQEIFGSIYLVMVNGMTWYLPKNAKTAGGTSHSKAHTRRREVETMKLWVCRKCGHEVTAKDRPQPIRWTGGEMCYFYEVKDLTEELTEIAGDLGATLIEG